jgi:hypothetical protein
MICVDGFLWDEIKEKIDDEALRRGRGGSDLIGQ